MTGCYSGACWGWRREGRWRNRLCAAMGLSGWSESLECNPDFDGGGTQAALDWPAAKAMTATGGRHVSQHPDDDRMTSLARHDMPGLARSEFGMIRGRMIRTAPSYAIPGK